MQFAVREFAMMITHRELLETSIAQLQTLAAFLNDQLTSLPTALLNGKQTPASKFCARSVGLFRIISESPRDTVV